MSMYWRLNEKIKEIVEAGIPKEYDLCIYPLGEQGLLAKQILNVQYGIEEAYIFDNKLCEINEKIKPITFLKEIDTNKIKLLIVSDSEKYWSVLRKDLEKYIDKKNIIDFFSIKPFEVPYEDRRLMSLELASREIYDRGIEGAVAEAGVYQGDFAKYINGLFYDRPLYLFDTFEGFSQKDIDVEAENNYCLLKAGHLGDTSLNVVMDKMPNKNNIIIRKGYFPETALGLEERFCFVSLDMDLYQPMKAALDYFYPRLNKGGYIFLHDCTIGHMTFDGARQALLEFAEEHQCGYVMLPDVSTAVITK